MYARQERKEERKTHRCVGKAGEMEGRRRKEKEGRREKEKKERKKRKRERRKINNQKGSMRRNVKVFHAVVCHFLRPIQNLLSSLMSTLVA